MSESIGERLFLLLQQSSAYFARVIWEASVRTAAVLTGATTRMSSKHHTVSQQAFYSGVF